jgi:predicted PhzF superfamily epimerase YddE/YHI9
MKLPLYVVDAFTDRVFSGNPAAVCPLDQWLDDATLQSIAAENNLAETAYFLENVDGYHIRWFTPTTEIDLCGHATVACAYVLFEHFGLAGSELKFNSKSGPLRVSREGDFFALDFPSRPAKRLEAPSELLSAIGGEPREVRLSRDYLLIFDNEQEVRNLRPDFYRLEKFDMFAAIATAPGTDCDFVSRFFAPGQGVPEDPVTGSAHCTLIPYWSERLGKKQLHARQISPRGGELFCEDRGDRVKIAGRAVLYSAGMIHI